MTVIKCVMFIFLRCAAFYVHCSRNSFLFLLIIIRFDYILISNAKSIFMRWKQLVELLRTNYFMLIFESIFCWLLFTIVHRINPYSYCLMATVQQQTDAYFLKRWIDRSIDRTTNYPKIIDLAGIQSILYVCRKNNKSRMNENTAPNTGIIGRCISVCHLSFFSFWFQNQKNKIYGFCLHFKFDW